MTQAYRYACMPRQRLTSGEFAVESVRPEHIERIRIWRNAQMNVLRQQEPIGVEAQKEYYEREVWPQQRSPRPGQILLAIFHRDRFVGYGGLVYINWIHLRAEVSFLVDPEIAADPDYYAEVFLTFLQLISQLAFDDIGLNRLTTETFEHRSSTIRILESAGFRLEGRLRCHVKLEGKFIDSLLHGKLRGE